MLQVPTEKMISVLRDWQPTAALLLINVEQNPVPENPVRKFLDMSQSTATLCGLECVALEPLC